MLGWKALAGAPLVKRKDVRAMNGGILNEFESVPTADGAVARIEMCDDFLVPPTLEDPSATRAKIVLITRVSGGYVVVCSALPVSGRSVVNAREALYAQLLTERPDVYRPVWLEHLPAHISAAPGYALEEIALAPDGWSGTEVGDSTWEVYAAALELEPATLALGFEDELAD